jgi:hypothetical protein
MGSQEEVSTHLWPGGDTQTWRQPWRYLRPARDEKVQAQVEALWA